MLNETAKLIEKRIFERAEEKDVSAEELRNLAEALAALHRNDIFKTMVNGRIDMCCGVGKKEES